MSQDAWLWSCNRCIPSERAAGQKVVNELLEQLRGHDWVEHDIFSVHLALEEALANAIKHGNKLDGQKHITVECQIAEDHLRVCIGDEGPGFCPDEIPDPTEPENIDRPCGRGIMLMKSFMSRVQFNGTGNCVMMEKDREYTE